jgi:hypothetical protein
VGYHCKPMGSISLDTGNPLAFFEKHFAFLNQLAAQSPSLSARDAQANADQIEDIGIRLYDLLFPEPLKKEYWVIHEAATRVWEKEKRALSLLVTSDEPWIPWEMVRPYEGREKESDFLAAVFQMSRWLAGRGPMDALTIKTACLVTPRLDLDFVEEEQRSIRSLAGRGLEIGQPIKTHADLLDVVRRGGVQLLHVATHGNFDPEHVDQSAIRLQDRSLYPIDLNRRRAAGLLEDRPIVFFNTCHSGRLGFSLTGLGGWASQMVDELSVTAYIGTHWEVNDELAAEFSRSFYSALLSGNDLGEAFHSARRTVREKQPGNPTWLAYTLYGDPNSRIELGG